MAADVRPDPESMRHLGELWRIEVSVTEVASEVRRLKGVDDERLWGELATLERLWRAELERILPDPLRGELHRLLDWLGDERASVIEVRLGLAQLEGWVDGLLAGAGIVVIPAPDPPPAD